MKKFLLPAFGLLASLLTAQAQYFTPGNLAVVRIGGTNSSGAGEYVTTSDDGNTVYIDQYTTNGTLVNSLPIPSSGPNALILSGEPYEGLMTAMPDQSHLVIIGYNTAYPYFEELIFSTNTVVPRIVATIDAYGNIAYPITNTSIFDISYVPTCAASDGTNYWAIGTGPSTGFNQVAYLGSATNGTTSYIIDNIFSSGGRSINVYNTNGTYQLYLTGYCSNSSQLSGCFVVSNISGALPTTLTGATNIFKSGSEASSTPSDFVINSSGSVAYLIDQGTNGIIKYTNMGNGWGSNYTILLTNTGFIQAGGQRGLSLTVDWTQTPAVLYAVTAETYTNRLVTLQDNGPGSTVVNLASNIFNPTGANSGTNSFRGVRFVPLPVPEFTVQPVAFFGVPGVTAAFSAAATGIPAPTYQWYSNSPANLTYVAIPGATSSNLSLANINQSQSGSLFYVVASNTYGTSQSAVVSLTVQNPAITTEPMGATNFPGTGPVTLCVSAIGTGTLTYQWLSNSVDIAGATSSCYTVPGSSVSNSALYSVIVSNASGSITSSVTTVAYTPYLLFDTLDYANGNLFTAPGTQWTEISGSSAIPTTNGRAQINESNGASSTAIGHDLFTQPQPEGTYVWASFTINLSTLPSSPGGVYFGSFADGAFSFFGKIYVLTSNNPAYTPDIPNVAYPGTYRIGIANYAGPDAVVELDMAPGIDYHVVVYYGVGGFAQVSVNPSPSEFAQSFYPSGPNTLTSGYASDSYGSEYTGQSMAAWELHEPNNVGVFELADLEVSYDWNGSGSGFAAVTAGFATNLPVIGLQPVGLTNYAGNPGILEAAASGIDLSYQWYLNGMALTDTTNFAGSESNALVFSYLTGSNSGSYTVVVSNEMGSVTSSVAVVSVPTTPTAPIFTVQPVSTTNSLGGTAVFTAMAVGTGPITYEWYQSTGMDTGVSGPTLTLTRVTTNMSGNIYYVVATGGTGLTNTSSNAVLTVNGPVVTNIAFLRSLQVTNAAPTITVPASNSVQVYQVTGTVMEYTNIESATYAEYWIQDSTAGIEFFVIDPSFRPHLGDLVTVTGIVDVYSDALELDGSANNPSEPYSITSTNGEGLPLPYPSELIPFGFSTANPGLSSLVYQGKLATFTNVYFTAPGTTFSGGGTFGVTNKAGQSYDLYIAQSAGPDLIGQTVPVFAYSVTGEFDQFDSDYELNLSAGFDIVTAPPPAVTNLVASLTGANITLTWPVAVSPNTTSSAYTYSVWSTTNLLVPFAPLTTGLWFGASNGTYTIPVSTNTPAAFYEIVSP